MRTPLSRHEIECTGTVVPEIPDRDAPRRQRPIRKPMSLRSAIAMRSRSRCGDGTGSPWRQALTAGRAGAVPHDAAHAVDHADVRGPLARIQSRIERHLSPSPRAPGPQRRGAQREASSTTPRHRTLQINLTKKIRHRIYQITSRPKVQAGTTSMNSNRLTPNNCHHENETCHCEDFLTLSPPSKQAGAGHAATYCDRRGFRRRCRAGLGCGSRGKW